MRVRALTAAALALCAITFSGCENGLCDRTNNPALQLLGALLGCTSEDVFEDELPTAAFSVTPENPRVGETVTFNAGFSIGGSGGLAISQLVGIEWDTDGDRFPDMGGFTKFDYSTPNPYYRVTRVYTEPGPVVVRLRITNIEGVQDDTDRVVTVLPAEGGGPVTPTPPGPPPPPGNQPPTARLTAAPNPVPPENEVVFDASGSTDDGTIASYAWDLDANGSIDPGAGTGPTARRVYPASEAPRQQRALVHVTDNAGATATAEVVLNLCAIAGCASHRARATGKPVTTALTVFGSVNGKARGGSVIVGRAKARFALSGRLPREGAKAKVPAIVRTLMRGRWTLGVSSVRKGRVRGRALVTTGKRGPTACASITLSPTKRKGVQQGTLKLLGGTGSAATTRVTVKFLATNPGVSLRIAGTLRATTGAAKRAPPRTCLPAVR